MARLDVRAVSGTGESKRTCANMSWSQRSVASWSCLRLGLRGWGAGCVPMTSFPRTLVALALTLALMRGAQGHDRPIIAIITHPSSSTNGDCGGDCELVEASYVKWIEAAGECEGVRDAGVRDIHLRCRPIGPQPATTLHPMPGPGARAVPLGYSWNDEQVDELMAQVNGVLFPGGGSSVPPSAYRVWHPGVPCRPSDSTHYDPSSMTASPYASVPPLRQSTGRWSWPDRERFYRSMELVLGSSGCVKS